MAGLIPTTAIEAGVRGEYERGMCSPVVIAGILYAAAVLATLRGDQEAKKHGGETNPRSGGLMQVLVGGFASVAFLWVLCFYGFPQAAWFFLLAPLVLAGFEIMAVINLLSDLALKARLTPLGPSNSVHQ